MSDFQHFAAAVEEKLDAMSKHELFVVDVENIFDRYLAAFPEGTNPVYRERTEHDCSCCKHFVRNVGNVVAVIDGKTTSIWDLDGLPEPYATVAQRMADLVKQLPIKSVFRTKERSFGVSSNVALIGAETVRFHHFVGQIDRRHQASEPDTVRGQIDARVQVFARGLLTLRIQDIDDVLDLISQNGLYRGAEFKSQLEAFKRLAQAAAKVGPMGAALFAWEHYAEPAAQIRNSVIGSLLVDLSEGVEFDRAVRSFEAKVAPTNYKRPTALITQKMVDQAASKLEELGLSSAVQRRFARLSDVSVNNVLWVDNSVKGSMKDGIAGLLAADVKPKAVDLKNAADISMDDFLANVLPKASGMRIALENKHLGNFMSLTAPVDPESGGLFKWPNNFAWSYDGDVADSIKSRVKAAGGNVSGTMRVSLAWSNYDDLDLHVIEPNRNRIYFANRSNKLDVDMNAGSGRTRDPVENVTWQGRVPDGKYQVIVNQFCRRESIDVGFQLEVEMGSEVMQFTSAKSPTGEMPCLVLTVKNGMLVSVEAVKSLVMGSASVEKWGVRTQDLVPVDTLMLSPNHWDGNDVGNKHWFFMLHGMKNPDAARGIYNEFLNPRLDPHRKVFEVLGARTKCAPADEQLSGVGFSSTRGDRVTVVVDTQSGSRAYNVQF